MAIGTRRSTLGEWQMTTIAGEVTRSRSSFKVTATQRRQWRLASKKLVTLRFAEHAYSDPLRVCRSSTNSQLWQYLLHGKCSKQTKICSANLPWLMCSNYFLGVEFGELLKLFPKAKSYLIKHLWVNIVLSSQLMCLVYAVSNCIARSNCLKNMPYINAVALWHRFTFLPDTVSYALFSILFCGSGSNLHARTISLVYHYRCVCHV